MAEMPQWIKEWLESGGLPPIEDVQRLNINPGDTLVVILEEHPPHRELERVRDLVKNILPENEVIVFGMPVRLAVLGPGDVDDA